MLFKLFSICVQWFLNASWMYFRRMLEWFVNIFWMFLFDPFWMFCEYLFGCFVNALWMLHECVFDVFLHVFRILLDNFEWFLNMFSILFQYVFTACGTFLSISFACFVYAFWILVAYFGFLLVSEWVFNTSSMIVERVFYLLFIRCRCFPNIEKAFKTHWKSIDTVMKMHWTTTQKSLNRHWKSIDKIIQQNQKSIKHIQAISQTHWQDNHHTIKTTFKW